MSTKTTQPAPAAHRKASPFNEKYGPWAVVTGASSGIGKELARLAAAEGLHTALVSRRGEALQRLADQLEGRFQVQTRVIAADLATDAGVDSVIEATNGLHVGLLVNNAGREDSGEFLSVPIEEALKTLHLNCRAPLRLTHHFTARMVPRKRGGVIFMSSIVAFQGVPFIANYAATKAYDLILSESLATELSACNVDVIAVAPGFTETNLSPQADFRGLPISPMSPADVAKQAFQKLGRTRLTIPGAVNKFLYFSGKYLQPRALNSFAFGEVFRRVLRLRPGRRGLTEKQSTY